MVSFHPSLIRSRSCSSGAYLTLSPSVFPPPIRFLSSASLPVPATWPLFLPFLLFPSLPHSGFLSAPLPLSLLWSSPLFPTWFPVSSSPVLRTRLPVRFLSPFPDSLPQLFLRCLPCAFAFGLFPSDLLPFVRFSSGSGYLAFCFFLSSSSPLRLTAAFSGAASPPFSFLAFPLPFHLVSRASLPFSSTLLSVCFLSSFPVSLPQLFHRCFPCAFAFGLSPHFYFLSSASARF